MMTSKCYFMKTSIHFANYICVSEKMAKVLTDEDKLYLIPEDIKVFLDDLYFIFIH